MRMNYPGCYYVPVKERIVELRRFSASDANTNVGAEKEWQVRATTTIIPDFVRKKLSTRDGWNVSASKAGGYVKTNEIYSWQSNPNGITCGIIGYDVLNNIPHYKPCRKPYVFLQNDIFDNIQQLLQAV
ncbi:hypothetical protein RhiirC2_764615 [Rhizophagus irregularis]|uniref:Uncharacterized protein n=1 Tax=Rhizophagus irregularis TaxID=588596 RepID=A0A2N1M1G7_9GLOM|nr:hypothetical protein RhiirC2_764615 [Rhizophagus irregularis]